MKEKLEDRHRQLHQELEEVQRTLRDTIFNRDKYRAARDDLQATLENDDVTILQGKLAELANRRQHVRQLLCCQPLLQPLLSAAKAVAWRSRFCVFSI